MDSPKGGLYIDILLYFKEKSCLENDKIFLFTQYLLTLYPQDFTPTEIERHTVLKYTFTLLNPVALRMAKTHWSFGRSECNRVNYLIMCYYIYFAVSPKMRSPIWHSWPNRRWKFPGWGWPRHGVKKLKSGLDEIEPLDCRLFSTSLCFPQHCQKF